MTAMEWTFTLSAFFHYDVHVMRGGGGGKGGESGH